MRKRGSSWEVRVYLGQDSVTGRERYFTKTVKGGKREAERCLSEMVGEAEAGRSVRTNSTVGELLEAWFEFAAPDFSPKTVKETRGFIDRNLLPTLGHVTLARLAASDLDRFYRKLQKSGGASGVGLAPGTIRRIHGILRRALNQGIKWGWLGVNPAAATTPPRVPKSDINPPSSVDLARVLRVAAAEFPELATYIALASATGARRSEVIALRWNDVDIDRRTVNIERGIVVGPDGLVEKDTKSHSARRVSLDDWTIAQLADHLARMQERADMCEVEMLKDAFVFSSAPDSSESWFPDSVSRSLRQLCRREGLAGVRLHDLRHFVATQLLSAGVDVRTVAGRLGYCNAATTLNVYAHFLAQSDRAAADIMGSLISGNGSEPEFH